MAAFCHRTALSLSWSHAPSILPEEGPQPTRLYQSLYANEQTPTLRKNSKIAGYRSLRYDRPHLTSAPVESAKIRPTGSAPNTTYQSRCASSCGAVAAIQKLAGPYIGNMMMLWNQLGFPTD